jgi:hypothetical protein
MMMLTKLKKAVLLMCILVFIAACAKGGSARGQFQGYALEKTEAEIVEKIGKPVEVDTKNPARTVLIYHKRTFDADNNDKIDPITRVILEKNKEGKFVCTSFEYL